MVAACSGPLRAVVPRSGRRPARRGGPGPAALVPLALPLVFSGFDPSTFEWARGLFAPLGFAPVMGTSRAGLPSEPLPDLAPGGAVGVSLIEGDLDLSVTGTITHIDDGRVYAFGHPFYNLGPTQFPMKKAYVYSVFPSLYQSWKIAAALDAVGTVDQDRTTAIAGRLGAPADDPGRGEAQGSRGGERASASASWRTSSSARCSPTSRCSRCSRATSAPSAPRPCGSTARLALSGGREVRIQDLFAENQPSQQAAALVAAPLASSSATTSRRSRSRSSTSRSRRWRPCRAPTSRGPGWSATARCARAPSAVKVQLHDLAARP